MKAGSACVDGEYLPLEQAVLPVSDEAFLSGWSVFETLRVEKGVPLYLDRHLARLATSASAVDLRCELDKITEECLLLAGAWKGLGRLRVALTGSGRRIVTLQELDPSLVHGGVRVGIVPQSDAGLPPSVKHANRLAWVLQVQRSGYDDLIFTDGKVLVESTRGAVWAAMDGALWSPPADGRSLASISREVIAERAGRLGIPVRRASPPNTGWDALYLSSSLRDLCPVVACDGRSLAGWEPLGRALVGTSSEGR